MIKKLFGFVKEHEKTFRSRKFASIRILQENLVIMQTNYTQEQINQFVDEACGKEIKRGIVWQLAGDIIATYPKLKTFQPIKIICDTKVGVLPVPYELPVAFSDITKLMKECQHLRGSLG